MLIHQILLKKADLASLEANVVELDIDELKNVPIDLSSLKSKVDKLDVDKMVPHPVDLSKLRDEVNYSVVKKTEYDDLVKKVNAIQTTVISDSVKKLTATEN